MGAMPALASLSGTAPNCCNHASPLLVAPRCDDTSASALNIMGQLAAQWRPRVCVVHHIIMKCNMDVQVKSESKRVWKFIIEREIEAPARFQAIQTHRAVMAILQQQACPFYIIRPESHIHVVASSTCGRKCPLASLPAWVLVVEVGAFFATLAD